MTPVLMAHAPILAWQDMNDVGVHHGWLNGIPWLLQHEEPHSPELPLATLGEDLEDALGARPKTISAGEDPCTL